MPAVDATTLLICDTAVRVFGAGVLLAFVVRLFRSPLHDDPLADVRPLSGGPTLAHCLALIALYLLALAWTMGLLRQFVGSEAPFDEPGTAAWHTLLAVETALRVAVAVAGGLILWKHPTFERVRASGGHLARRVGVVLLATPACVTVCMLQLTFTVAVWRWWNPGAEPPVHSALQAVEHSEWGAWGIGQLLVSAVLVAPLAEEVVFRGLLLQSVLRQTGLIWPAILVSAVAFGMIHAQPQDILPLITLGIMLGYLRVRTGSLPVCVGIHALFNARTLTLALLNPQLIRYGY